MRQFGVSKSKNEKVFPSHQASEVLGCTRRPWVGRVRQEIEVNGFCDHQIRNPWCEMLQFDVSKSKIEHVLHLSATRAFSGCIRRIYALSNASDGETTSQTRL